MGKIYLSFFSILFFLQTVNSQAIWGVDANIDVANAQFQNNFTETGTQGNYSNTTWTALSVNDSGGFVSPGQAYWKRNLSGYSQGAYWGGTTPVNSPSQSNGIAIFDSDYLDNNGIPGAFGNGSSPSSHRGELISPVFDLTGYTNVPLAVKFYSYYRNFNISQLSVAFSSDDGVTWGTPIDYRSLQNELTQGFITAILPTNSTQGVANLTQCRLKFIFDGEYYFAIVDDVTLMDATSILSTNSFTKNNINIYPNPTNGVFTVKTEEDVTVKVFDLVGKLIYSNKVSVGTNQIDISNYDSGVYLLQYSNNSGNTNTVKLIKE